MDAEKASPPPSPQKPPLPFGAVFPPNDPDDPHNWSMGKKLCVNLVLGYATLALTFNSSAFASSIPEIMAYYQVSYVVATLGVSLFVLGFASGPLLWGPLSDVMGRKIVYVASFALYTAFSLGVAFADNTASLLILRFLAGFSGSSAMTNSPPSIGDFAVGRQMAQFPAIYGASAFGGPALGPLISGFVASRAGMRWNFRLQAIIAGSAFLLHCITPETHNPTLLRRRLAREQKAGATELPPAGPTLAQRIKTNLTLPFIMLVSEPVVIAIALYMSVIYGLLYGLFVGLPVAFQEVRGFSREGLALVYISLLLGGIAGGLILGIVGARSVERMSVEAQKEGRELTPEDRLKGMRPIAPTVPLGLFIFAFTSYANVHWFGQMVGLFLFEMGVVVIFVSLVPYLLYSYLPYAGSAMAATAFCRAAFAAAFPIFTRQMFEALTVTGAVGLVAGVSLLLTPLPWLFVKYGARLRAASKYCL